MYPIEKFFILTFECEPRSKKTKSKKICRTKTKGNVT